MISWTKTSRTTLTGKVGDVECFDLAKSSRGYELTCMLPEATPGLYGRYITTHPNPRAAATHAEQVLKHWKRRFEK